MLSKNKVLWVFIQNPAQDMQKDCVAFEGWLLLLKYWLSGEINYVVLGFKAQEDFVQKYGCPEACHYNRFLYRLNNMTRFFPDWFFVDESKSDHLIELKRGDNKGLEVISETLFYTALMYDTCYCSLAANILA